jgi:hypothetical protein
MSAPGAALASVLATAILACSTATAGKSANRVAPRNSANVKAMRGAGCAAENRGAAPQAAAAATIIRSMSRRRIACVRCDELFVQGFGMSGAPGYSVSH